MCFRNVRNGPIQVHWVNKRQNIRFYGSAAESALV